jgi:hypothetical protein
MREFFLNRRQNQFEKIPKKHLRQCHANAALGGATLENRESVWSACASAPLSDAEFLYNEVTR